MESDGGHLFLETEDVVAIHNVLMDRTDPRIQPLYEDPIEPGIMDLGRVEAAVARHRWGPFPEGGGLAERASHLLRGIVQGHPFTDGNKRTGFEAADLFLNMNGFVVETSGSEVLGFLTDVARGSGHEEIIGWLRSHSRKV